MQRFPASRTLFFLLCALLSPLVGPLAQARFFFPDSGEPTLSSTGGNVSWTPLMNNEAFLEEIKEFEDVDPKQFFQKSEGLWEKFAYATEESMNICYQFQVYRKGAFFKSCEEDMKKFEEIFFASLYKARLNYLEFMQESVKKEFKASAQQYLKD